MCLVLTGIHAYLGIHVLAREVVFVDIALAQIAALGATAGFLVGVDLESRASYAVRARGHAGGGARPGPHAEPERHVSQEAVIGVVYAVSSAAAVLLVDARPTGPSISAGCWSATFSRYGADVARVASLYAPWAPSTGCGGAPSS